MRIIFSLRSLKQDETTLYADRCRAAFRDVPQNFLLLKYDLQLDRTCPSTVVLNNSKDVLHKCTRAWKHMTALPHTCIHSCRPSLCNWVTILKDMSVLQLHVSDQRRGGGTERERERVGRRGRDREGHGQRDTKTDREKGDINHDKSTQKKTWKREKHSHTHTFYGTRGG